MVRDQTRLPVLRIAGYEGFGGTQKLQGKVSVLLGLEKNKQFKNVVFLRKLRVWDPASAFTHNESFAALCAVGTTAQ